MGTAVVQVTPTMVRRLGEVVDTWNAPARISLVSANPESGQLAIAAGKRLFYLQVDATIELISETILDHEIACVDINPIGKLSINETVMNETITDNGIHSSLIAVGLWTEISVALLSLPNLIPVCRQPLGGNILPRSVLLCPLESVVYLLVALGDGTLFYYHPDMLDGRIQSSGQQDTLQAV